MTGTKPIATLGALLTAITEMVGSAEQRIMDRLGEIENRLITIDDKVAEVSAQGAVVKSDLEIEIQEVKDAIETLNVSAADSVIADIDELVDAERRRERHRWLPTRAQENIVRAS